MSISQTLSVTRHNDWHSWQKNDFKTRKEIRG